MNKILLALLLIASTANAANLPHCGTMVLNKQKIIVGNIKQAYPLSETVIRIEFVDGSDTFIASKDSEETLNKVYKQIHQCYLRKNEHEPTISWRR